MPQIVPLVMHTYTWFDWSPISLAWGGEWL